LGNIFSVLELFAGFELLGQARGNCKTREGWQRDAAAGDQTVEVPETEGPERIVAVRRWGVNI